MQMLVLTKEKKSKENIKKMKKIVNSPDSNFYLINSNIYSLINQIYITKVNVNHHIWLNNVNIYYIYFVDY